MNRRQLLALFPVLLFSTAARRLRVQHPHPEPRLGITAANVLRADQLDEHDAEVLQTFDMVRSAPGVMDGIYWYCGCDDVPDHYSLLSCFEGDGMAQGCVICQGEARLAYKLHKQGRSLAEIRRAIDRDFG